MRPRPFSLAATVVITALLLGGCSMIQGDDNANGGLALTTWTVTSIAGTSTIPGAEPTMAFDPDGTVTGTDGCNQYTGSFRTDGQTIQVGELATTRMACEPARTAQAGAFAAAFTGATEWRLTETGDLELRGHGDVLASPGAAAPPSEAPAGTGLEGTTWLLVDLDGSGDFAADVAPTLGFAQDGTLSGFSGCNTYSGPFTVDGATIDVGPLAGTKMACAGPGGDVESVYLPALDAVGSWEILPSGELVLSGPQVLTYRPG